MSNDKKNAATTSGVERCMAEGCKGSMQRLHFCNEHFVWYKEGLINKKGQRPNDFDKKYQHFLHKKAA